MNIRHLYDLSVWLLLWGIAAPGLAQQQPEYLYAHFDKPFYVAGEDMWYALYFMQPQQRQSNIVYTELVGPNGQYVARQRLRAGGSTAFADIALPPDLPQGYYLFRAYTSWNLNFSPQVIYEVELPVFRADAALAAGREEQPDIPPYLAPAGRIDLLPSKGHYLPGEALALSLRSEEALPATLSISILDERYAGSPAGNIYSRHEALLAQPPAALARGMDLIEPEKKYSQTFMLRKPLTQEYVNSNFIMGFIKQTQQKILRVAENGIVTFTFEDFYDSTIVQFFDANPFQQTYLPEVSLISGFYSLDPPRPSGRQPVLTASIQDYLRNYRKQFQVHQLFGTQTNMRARKADDKTATYTPTSVYEVDKFIEMENMEDFIRHVVPPVKVKKASKKAGGKREFELFVPHKGFKNPRIVQKPPLLIVNDYFTYDAEAVLNIDWKNVHRLEVYNDVKTLPAQFGPIGDFGVIALYTRDGHTPPEIIASANNIKISGFYLPRTFE
ncbi:MAG: hypothetical protein D6730_15950, partial [Bacteroidetes bacterium]